DPREEFVGVRRDRLGIESAEVRVALGMELDKLRLAAAEQAREVSAGAAVEGLAHDAIPRAAERVEIEKLRNAREIVGRGIEQLDPTGRLRILVRHPVHVLRTRRERMDDGLE